MAISHDINVTRALLEKYDKPGPRYTSYPTAPEWNPAFGEADYLAALRRASLTPETPLSVYVHLPFCWERCLFCGCNVVISKKPSIAGDYLNYLEKEMGLATRELGARKLVKQLHWGGGTPTYLNVEEIRRLFGMIQKVFTFAPDAEIALEADPRVTSAEQLDTLRELGFNRISMGVQDLDPGVQAAITRNQSEAQTRLLFDRCRERGFQGINIDLIYGLPEQTLATWEYTIKSTIDIRPDRLAVYSYAHLPAQIKHQKKIDHLPRPTGAEKWDLFALARKLFLDAGYRAIGMDHFALPEDELAIALDERRLHRNFMGYSVVPAEDMIGFGTSAIGEIGGCYAQNEKRPVNYYKALDQDHLPIHTGITLTQDDTIRRWAIRQVMCNFYLDFAELERRFGVTYDGYFGDEERLLAEYYGAEMLVREAGALRVLPLGQVFIRNIAMVFDLYLRKPEHFNAFSRTV
ncbi:MAG: oxygen-independent coproporphyrinogen III oxidase [Candidatus Hydrogenedentes bacterium]|nr:oxygen-independent coproporphyrinogen III oxidase [Candidatus Hydrogenedentota bacterium]